MDFLYFGYGSNMDAVSLRAKGVLPLASAPAHLPGWQLRFNVQHFFAHEGGVGNIEPAPGGPGTGLGVWGVLHRCPPEALALLDAAELYPHGYDRVPVAVHTGQGAETALAYVGTPGFVNDACRPTRRYLNILLQGALRAGLPAGYVAALQATPVLDPPLAPPFVPPAGDFPAFDAATLARAPRLTALADAVFDMADARWQHRLLWPHYGGRDMTLHHLRRMDSARGDEDESVLQALSPAQRQVLDRFLHAYAAEYRYAGRYLRPPPPSVRDA